LGAITNVVSIPSLPVGVWIISGAYGISGTEIGDSYQTTSLSTISQTMNPTNQIYTYYPSQGLNSAVFSWTVQNDAIKNYYVCSTSSNTSTNPIFCTCTRIA
jgi:hypothetical protein